MDASLPNSRSARHPSEREKLRRVVAARGLAGLANDTKWDEFVQAMRARGWRPRFRYKCVDGPVSGWDGEWCHHLPFPLISVEWLDVAFLQEEKKHGLAAPQVTDHSPWIEAILSSVGLDFRKGAAMIRIFGYAPRSLEHFDP